LGKSHEIAIGKFNVGFREQLGIFAQSLPDVDQKLTERK